MINLLIGVPSPRDIQIVENCLNVIKYDKLYAKYMNEPTAYSQIRNYFLKNEKYTHLAISPDDMLVTPNKIQDLVDGLEEQDFETLSGWSNNVGRGDGSKLCSISKNLPPKTKTYYDCWKEDEIRKVKKIITVGFSGFPFQIIRRDVVKKIPFEGLDCGSGETRAFDVGFAHSCHKLKIPLHVDTRVHFIHLKGILPNAITNRLLVGKKQPKLVLVTP